MGVLTHALREATYLVLLLSLPPALAIGLVGLVSGLFQSATQIRERSLSTIPKIVAAALALLACGPWIGAHLLAFTRALLDALPLIGRS